jgi:hypothetical protein
MRAGWDRRRILLNFDDADVELGLQLRAGPGSPPEIEESIRQAPRRP